MTNKINELSNLELIALNFTTFCTILALWMGYELYRVGYFKREQAKEK